jgi:hypothetical protein
MDQLDEYDVSATFNVFYLFLFDIGDDSRTNHFEKRGNDAIQATPRNPLKVQVGLVTRLEIQKDFLMDFFKTHELR